MGAKWGRKKEIERESKEEDDEYTKARNTDVYVKENQCKDGEKMT